jgi:PAS domain S-box-containing protein
VHPDDREWVLAENERANTEGVPLALEYRMIAEDDRVVWLRDESVVLRDGEGRPWRRQGIMHDVTERVGAEEALRESERRLSTLLANAPAYLYRCRNEPGWPNEFVSDYAQELTGHSPDELTDGSVMFGDLIVDEDRQRVWDEVQKALAEHQRIVLRYAIRRKDGQIRHVEEHGQGVYGDYGGVEAIEGVVYDVTERVRAEEALKESEAILAEAQRLAHLGSWDWDVRSDKVRWSDETFRIYGLAPQVFVPSFDKLLAVVHPEDRKTLSKHLNAVLHEDKPYDFEHRIVRPDGEVRMVHRRAEMVRDENGEPLKMVGTVHDITERKALEEKLEHQALHDPLTNLPNRALFMDRLRHALSRAKRRKDEVAVLFMDLDNFKVINDSLGHRAGDKVLVAASKRLQSSSDPRIQSPDWAGTSSSSCWRVST